MLRLRPQTRMNGGTNIALSLKQAGQLLREEDPRAARVIILLTDGRVDTFQGGRQCLLPLAFPRCLLGMGSHRRPGGGEQDRHVSMRPVGNCLNAGQRPPVCQAWQRQRNHSMLCPRGAP